MRSLTITAYAEKAARLPLSYNALIQGALYRCWSTSNPNLHNRGYSANGKEYRLFTFSKLSGKSSIDKTKKEISFTGAVQLTVRSPQEELLDDLCSALVSQGAIRLGRTELPLINLSTADRLLFPKRALIKLITPVTLHRTHEDGYTEYLVPTSEEFARDLQSNCANKAASFGLDAGLVQMVPLEETLRKHVVQFKGTYVNGWTGELILAAKPETMAFLYNAGLGARNSQGFGMFEIVDKPL